MERHNQTQVFWYLPVICGGPLKVPWDHRRRLLCFDESPLSTNVSPADLFWPCLCKRGDYHNTPCPVWSSKPLTNETCGRHDQQLLPSVIIIIRQSTRQRSVRLLWIDHYLNTLIWLSRKCLSWSWFVIRVPRKSEKDVPIIGQLPRFLKYDLNVECWMTP